LETPRRPSLRGAGGAVGTVGHEVVPFRARKVASGGIAREAFPSPYVGRPFTRVRHPDNEEPAVRLKCQIWNRARRWGKGIAHALAGTEIPEARGPVNRSRREAASIGGVRDLLDVGG